MKTYKVNEIFYSVQGEGVRAGTANVFLRFSRCNLRCSVEGEAGFDCDTEFETGARLDLDALMESVLKVAPPHDRAIILTGGEPALQTDSALLKALHEEDFFVAIETNGTIELPTSPEALDWICVSPKTAFHTLRQKWCEEFKLVRHCGQELPGRIPVERRDLNLGMELLVSPAWPASGTGDELMRNLEWCIDLVKRNPEWRLSCQQHKWWGVR